MFRRTPQSICAGLGRRAARRGVVGVQLGESAIAEIDPIHFQGAAVHPRDRGAAIDPATRSRRAQAGYRPGLWLGRGPCRAARRMRGMRALSGDAAYAGRKPPPAPARRRCLARRQPPPPSLKPWPPGEVSARGDPAVERYIDYPIEEKPAVEAAEAESPAAPDKAVED